MKIQRFGSIGAIALALGYLWALPVHADDCGTHEAVFTYANHTTRCLPECIVHTYDCLNQYGAGVKLTVNERSDGTAVDYKVHGSGGGPLVHGEGEISLTNPFQGVHKLQTEYFPAAEWCRTLIERYCRSSDSPASPSPPEKPVKRPRPLRPARPTNPAVRDARIGNVPVMPAKCTATTPCVYQRDAQLHVTLATGTGYAAAYFQHDGDFYMLDGRLVVNGVAEGDVQLCRGAAETKGRCDYAVYIVLSASNFAASPDDRVLRELPPGDFFGPIYLRAALESPQPIAVQEAKVVNSALTPDTCSANTPCFFDRSDRLHVKLNKRTGFAAAFFVQNGMFYNLGGRLVIAGLQEGDISLCDSIVDRISNCDYALYLAVSESRFASTLEDRALHALPTENYYGPIYVRGQTTMTPTPPTVPPDSRPNWVRPLSVVGLVVGGLSIGTWAVTGLMASKDGCPLACRSNDALERYDDLKTASTIAFYSGLALSGLGVLGLLVAPSNKEDAIFTWNLGPGHAAMGLSF